MDIIECLESKETKAVTIDDKQLSIRSNLTLHQLYQKGGDSNWYDSGKESRMIVLVDDTVILRILKEENGEYVWVKGKVIDRASKYQGFFKGDNENPGPARRFAQSQETANISFNLQEKEWTMKDLGAVKVETRQNISVAENGDKLYGIIAKSGEEDWLYYLDARIGEARGTGALIIGKEFNPTIDIKEVL